MADAESESDIDLNSGEDTDDLIVELRNEEIEASYRPIHFNVEVTSLNEIAFSNPLESAQDLTCAFRSAFEEWRAALRKELQTMSQQSDKIVTSNLKEETAYSLRICQVQTSTQDLLNDHKANFANKLKNAMQSRQQSASGFSTDFSDSNGAPATTASSQSVLPFQKYREMRDNSASKANSSDDWGTGGWGTNTPDASSWSSGWESSSNSPVPYSKPSHSTPYGSCTVVVRYAQSPLQFEKVTLESVTSVFEAFGRLAPGGVLLQRGLFQARVTFDDPSSATRAVSFFSENQHRGDQLSSLPVIISVQPDVRPSNSKKTHFVHRKDPLWTEIYNYVQEGHRGRGVKGTAKHFSCTENVVRQILAEQQRDGANRK